MNKRAQGALVGSAVGDALGAGYEFTTPSYHTEIEMIGGGFAGFDRGEWTDDTDQAMAVAHGVLEDGLTTAGLDRTARMFMEWYMNKPKDVGNQTRAVLHSILEQRLENTELNFAQESYNYHTLNGEKSGGNGSLMRITPLGVLMNRPVDEVLEYAVRTSKLTHYDDDAAFGSALWAMGIRYTVETGNIPDFYRLIDVLVELGVPRSSDWYEITEQAFKNDPNKFNPNGYVVHAYQACVSTLNLLDYSLPPAELFVSGLDRVIKVGNDTDTTACILGGLLGAYVGIDAIRPDWAEQIFGWPNSNARSLIALADTLVYL